MEAERGNDLAIRRNRATMDGTTMHRTGRFDGRPPRRMRSAGHAANGLTVTRNVETLGREDQNHDQSGTARGGAV